MLRQLEREPEIRVYVAQSSVCDSELAVFLVFLLQLTA